MRAICPICGRNFSVKRMRRIYYKNLRGFICRNCYREILLHKLLGEKK